MKVQNALSVAVGKVVFMGCRKMMHFRLNLVRMETWLAQILRLVEVNHLDYGGREVAGNISCTYREMKPPYT